MTQRSDGCVTVFTGIDQVLGQCAKDSVSASVNGANAIGCFSGGFDQATGASINDRVYTPRLGIECVFQLAAIKLRIKHSIIASSKTYGIELRLTLARFNRQALGKGRDP